MIFSTQIFTSENLQESGASLFGIPAPNYQEKSLETKSK